MWKKYSFHLKIILIVLGGLAIPTFVSSEENMFNFQMQPIHPLNQISQEIPYFDLMVKPSSQQKLSLLLSNNDETKKIIYISPVISESSQNGVINYPPIEKVKQLDDTLVHPFPSLIKEKSQTIKLKPKETKKVEFTLTVPEKPFEGIILGGFLAEAIEDTDDNPQKTGVENIFRIINAVKIRESNKKVASEFKINDIKPTIVSSELAVTANIQNKAPILIEEMEVTTEFYRENSKKSFKKETKKGLKMAPNSNFDFPTLFSKSNLDPGNYRLNLTIKEKGNTQTFKKEFTIHKNELYKLKKSITPTNENTKKRIIVILGIFVVLLFLFVCFYYSYYRKTQKMSLKKKKYPKKRKQKTKKKSK